MTLTQVSGTVETRRGQDAWGPASRGQALAPGGEIKTGRGARCVLAFDDGSKVEIGPNALFTLEEEAPKKDMRLGLGFLKAWVSRTFSQRFVVRTPTAVCSVRGTEFGVAVREDGGTSVELFKGLLGVADRSGNEALLKDGQRIEVGERGLGQVLGSAPRGEESAERLRAAMKREVGLDMAKEEVQAAAALEAKTAIYKEGKAMIDVHGGRVRIEEYVMLPKPDQFKLVVLNERAERFDYFFYLGSFNKTLPEDLSVALRQLQGQADAAPEFFLRSYQTGRSNTSDSVVELASGGHLVDVNNNGAAADAVTSVFDPGTDSVVRLNVPTPGSAGNQPFYRAIFDNYSLAFNGVIHHSWAPASGVTPYNGAAQYSPSNTTGAQNTTTHLSYTDLTYLVTPPNCSTTDTCTGSPDPGKLQNIVYLENTAGTVWEKFDHYIISDEGKVADASEFSGITKGADFKRMLLNWNFEQIITASEFEGRKIDLVVEPKIMIQSGLIP